MRVVFLRSNPVDPDSRVEKEVNSLIRLGYEVELLAWDRENKYKIRESYLNLESGKVKIYRFGIPATFGGGLKSNLAPLIEFQIKVSIWLFQNKNKYDVIHACDFDTAYLSFKFAKLFKKRFVYDIFDYYVDAFGVPGFLKSFIEKKDHKIINKADAAIICSEKRKEQIKGTTPRRLEVIHNTPNNVQNTLKKLNLSEDKIKIVYVGILAGGRFLKEVVDIVSQESNYEFHIGGFGVYENYFEEMSKKFCNIKFYGKLPYDKTLELENSCDIMIAVYDPKVLNNYYAAPNKFYEALMLGKPLIMAKNTGMSEVIQGEEIGEVIDYDTNSLSKALSRIVERKREWLNIGQKAKKIYYDNYSWEQMEGKLQNLYKDISSYK